MNNNNPGSSDSSKENSFQGLWPPPSTTANVAGGNETRSRPPSINMLDDNESRRPPPVAGDLDESCLHPPPPNVVPAAVNETRRPPPPNVPAAANENRRPPPPNVPAAAPNETRVPPPGAGDPLPPNVPAAANETRPHPRPNLNVPGANETHEKPKKKKKKTREIIVGGDPAITTVRLGGNSNVQFLVGRSAPKKPKPVKRPDLNAPPIMCPCVTCDKSFWSIKALFGHMRCHPERGWRGIVPPEKRRRRRKRVASASADPRGSGLGRVDMNEVDQEIAKGLLMLANGVLSMDGPQIFNDRSPETFDSETHGYECSSCKRIFGSHQALGGHRASHKKVKGCFAIDAKNSDDSNNENRNNEEDSNGSNGTGSNDRGKWKGKAKVTDEQGIVSGHRCGICGKIFASGQALGGHMRCHWDRSENSSSSSMMFHPQQQLGGIFFNPSTTGCSTSYANTGQRDGSTTAGCSTSYANTGQRDGSTTAGCSTSYANIGQRDGSTGFALDLNMPPPEPAEAEPEPAPAPVVDDANGTTEDSSSSSTTSSEMDLDLKLGF